MAVGSTYKVSALRRRPHRFNEVIGQKPITDTLTRAIASDQIPHALLFCGPRGVGKTTCARIFAREVNGWGDKTEEEAEGLLDIFELDAASNRKIEHMRELIKEVRHRPVSGKYKIYIIDEVHMLTKEAFNAFLKTLEEPPNYVIFILATTEKQKVLSTILSRCQIFDFQPFSQEEIYNYLDQLAKEDGVKREDSVLQAIAKQADGAMRDALSLYDLLRTCAGDKGLTQEGIAGHWCFLDEGYFFDLTKKLHRGDLREALIQLDEALTQGARLDHFLVEWGSCTRDLLLGDLLAEKKKSKSQLLAGRTEDQRGTYVETAKVLGRVFLLRVLRQIDRALLDHRQHLNPRLGVEMVLAALSGAVEAPVSPAQGTSAPNPAASLPTPSPKASESSTTTASKPNEAAAARKTPRTGSVAKDPSEPPSATPNPNPTAQKKNEPKNKAQAKPYTDGESFQALKAQYPILETLESKLDLRAKM